MKRKRVILAIAVILLCCLLFSETVNEGAKQGLLLWFNVVVPALLPFMILSGMIVRLGITALVGRAVYPLVRRLFSVSRNGCYPIVIGLLSGYPLGAKTAADMCRQQDISREEAEFLLSICNNASPMFLLEYMGVYCLHLQNPAWVLIIVYLSGFVAAALHLTGQRLLEILLRRRTGRRTESGRKPPKGKITACQTTSFSIMDALDQSIMDSFLTLARVGGYIILFSISVKLLQQLVVGETLLETVLLGCLEITTGGEALQSFSAPASVKAMIGIGICAFGGLSSVAQTASVIRGSGLSTNKYIEAKLWQAAVAVLLAGLLPVA